MVHSVARERERGAWGREKGRENERERTEGKNNGKNKRAFYQCEETLNGKGIKNLKADTYTNDTHPDNPGKII